MGVPAGVKVYSSVFAVSPGDAATILSTFERTEEREISDIYEDEYRLGEASPDLKSVIQVPIGKHPTVRTTANGTVTSLAEGVSDDMLNHPYRTYILGLGSTVGGSERQTWV